MTNQKQRFILRDHNGHDFLEIEAADWEAADAVARGKGWEVDDHFVGTDDRQFVSVVPPRAKAPVRAPLRVVK